MHIQPEDGAGMLLQVNIGDRGGYGGFAGAGCAMQDQLLALAQAQEQGPQQVIAADGAAEADAKAGP